MSDVATECNEVHLLEAGGAGGVYQHTVAVAVLLENFGFAVTVHTSAMPEFTVSDVEFCKCIKWYSWVRNRRLRQMLTVLHAISVSRRHLRVSASKTTAFHIQGATLLNAPLLFMNRLDRWGRVIFSPHNTFDRHGIKLGSWLMRHWARKSDRVFVFAEPDRQVVVGWGAEPVLAPLIQYAPHVEESKVAVWRERLLGGESDSRLALFAGQIREDKRPDVFVRAIARMHDVRGAVVGEDRGALKSSKALANELGAEVVFVNSYLDMHDFTAAILAADVVVAPYSQASQSGVLALASALGVPTVATDVGGLREFASALSGPSVAEFAETVDEVLNTSSATGGRLATNYPTSCYRLIADKPSPKVSKAGHQSG